MASTHLHHGDAKKSNRSKIDTIVGHTDKYRHHTDKAADMAYYQNEHLDPLTLPAEESVGPLPVADPPGSQLKRK